MSNKNNSWYFSDFLFFLLTLANFNTNGFLVTSDTTYASLSEGVPKHSPLPCCYYYAYMRNMM